MLLMLQVFGLKSMTSWPDDGATGGGVKGNTSSCSVGHMDADDRQKIRVTLSLRSQTLFRFMPLILS